MSLTSLLTLLRYLFCVPNNLLGVLLLLPYGADWRSFEFRRGRVVCTVKCAIGNPGAQTWGQIIMAVGEEARARINASDALWYHEDHHGYQALKWWGIPFLVIYGGEWLGRFVFRPGPAPSYARNPLHHKRWFRAYFNLRFEREAREVAGQVVT